MQVPNLLREADVPAWADTAAQKKEIAAADATIAEIRRKQATGEALMPTAASPVSRTDP